MSELFDSCPRCSNNIWSLFQTGNENNSIYFFHVFCNECHNFSFNYNCSPNGDNKILEFMSISTDKYMIKLNPLSKTTEIYDNYGIKLFAIDAALSFNLFATNTEMNSRIKTLILLS